MNLELSIGGLKLSTPLIAASGLFGYGDGYCGLVEMSSFGAVVTKTITRQKRDGNPPPRLVDFECGLINSIGLENVGVDRFLDEVLPELEIGTRLIVSIGGSEIEEYAEIARRLSRSEGIDAVEVNISCPNIRKGGIAFGSDADVTGEVIGDVRSQTNHLLIAKLPPLIVGIEEIAVAAQEAGADAITIANTYPAMSIDIESERPMLGAITGGLSGRAIKPMTLRLVWTAFTKLNIPIIASGGIENATDCVEYMLAGASAVEIGSVILRDLNAPKAIVEGLKDFMVQHGYEDISQLIGRAHEREKRRDIQDNQSCSSA